MLLYTEVCFIYDAYDVCKSDRNGNIGYVFGNVNFNIYLRSFNKFPIDGDTRNNKFVCYDTC